MSGCVYFTQPQSARQYRKPPHDVLVAEYPIFTDTPLEADPAFAAHLAGLLLQPNVSFAKAFEAGHYCQDRSFCTQVAAQVADPRTSPFVLLDHQRRGLELCKAKIAEALASAEDPAVRKVILIEGPPGSGKSAIAAQLWAWLARDQRLARLPFVITTTSSSQRRNWESLFQRAMGGHRGARGFVRPANSYSPGTTTEVGSFQKAQGVSLPPERWRENVCAWEAHHGGLVDPDGLLVSIVDEAHALINPEDPKARTPAGWPVAFGPQAYHIIRSSKVSVFLMDGDQGFRDRECTRPDDIRGWADELRAEVTGPVSLAGAQFRLAGAVEYMDWLDGFLGLRTETAALSWRRTLQNPAGNLVFEVAPDPLAVEETLRPLLAKGDSARLLAAYGVPWTSKPQKSNGRKGTAGGKGLPDFDFEFDRAGSRHRWRKIWNWIPDQDDYTQFVQAPPGSRMAADPLSEVGCPYVVRGFDYDWVGLLWLRDLVWRSDRWVVDLDHIHETGVLSTLQAARRERKAGQLGPAHAELVRRTAQAYRILLSRAMKGIIVWVADDETCDHIRRELSGS